MSNQIQTIVDVSYENRDKKTVFWRGILVAPVIAFVASFTQVNNNDWAIGGFFILPALLALVVRGVYPSYVLTFNHAFLELQTRVGAYLMLLTDDYPSIERNPRIAVLLPDIDGGRKLSRGLPLIKWLFALPHYLLAVVYIFMSWCVTVVAWVITFSTGNYPVWAGEFVLRVLQYLNRVVGYAILLVTDEYPPFTL